MPFGLMRLGTVYEKEKFIFLLTIVNIRAILCIVYIYNYNRGVLWILF